MNSVNPHEFDRLRRFFNRGRCRACYIPEKHHPVRGWTLARPFGDKSLPQADRKIADRP